jgi:hypothetical protein
MAPEGFAAVVSGVNDAGEAAGQAASGAYAPGYWTPDGAGGWAFVNVNPGRFTNITITDLNNSRELVGFQSGARKALYWSSPSAEPEALPIPPGFSNPVVAGAYSINNNGDAVGYLVETITNGNRSSTINHAVVWHHAGGVWSAVLLPQINPPDTRAYDINDDGLIAGDAGGAVLWVGSGTNYTGTVIVSSQAALTKIDRCGRAVGYTAGNTQKAWVWENGTTTYLPFPPGAVSTQAIAIATDLSTGEGIVVGRAPQRGNKPPIPVRWTIPGCP